MSYGRAEHEYNERGNHGEHAARAYMIELLEDVRTELKFLNEPARQALRDKEESEELAATEAWAKYDIPVRARNALIRNSVLPEEFANTTDETLLAEVRNLGSKSIVEVRKALAENVTAA